MFRTCKEDDILTECGMDSVEMIQLVIELETHFEFEFEDEKLSYETLRSINTIVSYIYMRLGEH